MEDKENVIEFEDIKADDAEDSIKEIEAKIDGMKKDKEAKCKAAKEQLVEMLSITSDKYLTATGTAEALRVLRFALGSDAKATIKDAVVLAHELADEALAMATKASETPYDQMDKICEGFYEQNFVLDDGDLMENEDHAFDLAYEMMRIDLCRNVGGAAEDMVEFIKRAQGEVDAMGEELNRLKKENSND